MPARQVEAWMQFAGSSRQAPEAVRSAAPKTSAAPPPSWRRVLLTTISLWASRRLARFRRARPAVFAVAIVVLAVTAAAAAVLVFAGTSSRAAGSSPQPGPRRPGPGRAAAGVSSGAAAAVRYQAAAWVASQVSGDETVACDPLTCAALEAHGVASGRLLPLRPAMTGAPQAGVIVASPADQTRSGSRPGAADLPVLLASFGSGAGRVDVRASYPGGAAAYRSALPADLAARRSAGAQLLRSGRIMTSAQGARQLDAGEVDARLLVTLATLAAQQSWRVVAFGDASPGDQVPLAAAPFRQVTMTPAGGRGGTAGLAAALALMRAQRTPYRPAAVTLVGLAAGRIGLRIDFAAPGPLGLLTDGGSG